MKKGFREDADLDKCYGKNMSNLELFEFGITESQRQIIPRIPTSEIKHTNFSAFLSCQKPNISVAKCTFYLFFI